MSQFPQGQQYQHADRSTLILVLGILGIVLCALCAPFAWIMGKGDLTKMAAGTMDPANRGVTKGGMICGIIGTVLMVIGVVLTILWILFFVVLAAAAAGSTP